MNECFSFNDLFQAAFGREVEDSEMEEFSSLSQEEKNIKVKEWAEMAQWLVEDRIGSDGITYTAFFKPNSSIS